MSVLCAISPKLYTLEAKAVRHVVHQWMPLFTYLAIVHSLSVKCLSIKTDSNSLFERILSHTYITKYMSILHFLKIYFWSEFKCNVKILFTTWKNLQWWMCLNTLRIKTTWEYAAETISGHTCPKTNKKSMVMQYIPYCSWLPFPGAVCYRSSLETVWLEWLCETLPPAWDSCEYKLDRCTSARITLLGWGPCDIAY